jgi:glycosyltransferase involved in cell wall biosynthesis
MTAERGLPAIDSERTIASLSIVIPVFNEVESVPLLYDEIVATADSLSLPWELIFIDDGSSDGTTRVLHEVYERDPRVQIIEFRRNFGKSAALAAGFEAADGDAIITMDGDMKDLMAEVV